MLEVRGLRAFYGSSQALFGVDLEVGDGEVATLLGRNGMGKTTTVRCIVGLTRPASGTIRLAGRAIERLPAHAIARAGVGLVPEGRQVFPTLSVEENLSATARPRPDGWDLEGVYDLFPPLRERARHLGGQLSGGEQQMLAIARALMTNPRLLVLDEATEGLAPLVRREIWACLEGLRRAGQTMLVIDKHLQVLLRLADRHHVLAKGRVVWSGSSDALAASRAMQGRYLGV